MAYSDDFGPTPENIKLQLGAVNVVHTFDFSDALASGITISSCTVKAYRDADDKTTELVGTTAVVGNTVTVPLKAPADPGIGTYQLEFTLTLSDGSTLPLVYNRYTVVNE